MLCNCYWIFLLLTAGELTILKPIWLKLFNEKSVGVLSYVFHYKRDKNCFLGYFSIFVLWTDARSEISKTNIGFQWLEKILKSLTKRFPCHRNIDFATALEIPYRHRTIQHNLQKAFNLEKSKIAFLNWNKNTKP